MRKPRVTTVATPQIPTSLAVSRAKAAFGAPGLFAHHVPNFTAVGAGGANPEKPRLRLASAAGARSPMGV